MILLVTLLSLKDFFFPWVKKITSVTISFSSSNRNHCLEISFLWLSLYINTCIYIIHYRDIQDMNWIKESSQKDFSFQMFYFHLCNKEKILVINVLLCLGNNSIVSPVQRTCMLSDRWGLALNSTTWQGQCGFLTWILLPGLQSSKSSSSPKSLNVCPNLWKVLPAGIRALP